MARAGRTRLRHRQADVRQGIRTGAGTTRTTAPRVADGAGTGKQTRDRRSARRPTFTIRASDGRPGRGHRFKQHPSGMLSQPAAHPVCAVVESATRALPRPVRRGVAGDRLIQERNDHCLISPYVAIRRYRDGDWSPRGPVCVASASGFKSLSDVRQPLGRPVSCRGQHHTRLEPSKPRDCRWQRLKALASALAAADIVAEYRYPFSAAVPDRNRAFEVRLAAVIPAAPVGDSNLHRISVRWTVALDSIPASAPQATGLPVRGRRSRRTSALVVPKSRCVTSWT